MLAVSRCSSRSFSPPSHSHPGTPYPEPLDYFLCPPLPPSSSLSFSLSLYQPTILNNQVYTQQTTTQPPSTNKPSPHHHDRIKLILTLPPHTIAMASPPQQIASMLNATTCRPSPRTCLPQLFGRAPPPPFDRLVLIPHAMSTEYTSSATLGLSPPTSAPALGHLDESDLLLDDQLAQHCMFHPPSRFHHPILRLSFSPPPSLPWCIHKKTVPTNTFIKSPLPGPHAEDEARSPTSKSRRTNGGESTSAPAPPAANKSSWFHLVFLKSASQHTTPQTTHTTLLLLPTQYASPYSDIFYFLTTTIDLFSFRSTTNSSSNGYREHIDGGNKKAHWGTAGKTK